MKLVFSQPGFIFTIAVAQRVLEDYLDHRFEIEYGSQRLKLGGTLYLDKIVQLSLPLPPHHRRFEMYIRDLLMKSPAFKVVARLPAETAFLAAVRQALKLEPGDRVEPEDTTQIHTLTLRGELSRDDLRKLGTVENLRSLVLPSASDEVIARLPRLSSLSSLNLADSSVTDAGMRFISKITTLKHLTLSATAVSDLGIGHLRALPQLSRLELRATKVTDEAVAMLANSTTLRALNLIGTGVTDKGLATIATMMQVEDVDLGHCKVTDVGVEALSSLPELRLLSLWRTSVTDRCTSALSSVTNLWYLDLDMTKITAAGLGALVRLPSLNSLDLSRAGIGDEAVDVLSQMESLTSLKLRSTAISKDGVEELRMRLPGCEITADVG